VTVSLQNFPVYCEIQLQEPVVLLLPPLLLVTIIITGAMVMVPAIKQLATAIVYHHLVDTFAINPSQFLYSALAMTLAHPPAPCARNTALVLICHVCGVLMAPT